jgi:hypothetical protein
MRFALLLPAAAISRTFIHGGSVTTDILSASGAVVATASATCRTRSGNISPRKHETTEAGSPVSVFPCFRVVQFP